MSPVDTKHEGRYDSYAATMKVMAFLILGLCFFFKNVTKVRTNA